MRCVIFEPDTGPRIRIYPKTNTCVIEAEEGEIGITIGQLAELCISESARRRKEAEQPTDVTSKMEDVKKGL